MATPDDAGSVASLLGELGYGASEPGLRERLAGAGVRSSSRVYVAQTGAAVVGLLCAEILPYFPDGSHICRVTALVVSAPCRDRGIGRALVEEAAAFASSRGCSGVEITSRECRADAHRFYERLGFRRTSLRFFLAL